MFPAILSIHKIIPLNRRHFHNSIRHTSYMDTFYGNVKDPTPKKSLTITAKANGRLSGSQLRFNKLTDRIRKLEKEIVRESAKLEKLFGVFTHTVQPFILEHAGMMATVAGLLDGFAGTTKLKKRQSEMIQDMILDLCDSAFDIIPQTAEHKAIHDKWNDASFDAEYRHHVEESTAGRKEMLKEEMGLDIDMSDIDDTADGYARFRQKGEEKTDSTAGGRSHGKKSKKRIAVEVQLKAEDELKARSLRSIYIALAKVLHPDTEIEPELKAEKEELMKQVTQAYTDKDLTKLLRLEMDWVRHEGLHADRLSEDTLKIYISALEDQVADLKQEKSMLPMHTRFVPVADLADLQEWRALNELQRESIRTTHAIADLARFKNTLESTLPPHEIIRQIKEYAETHMYNDTPFEEPESMVVAWRR